MAWTWILLNVLFGLCIGSFFNVLIHRLPRGESIISAGSACPHCGEPVRWYDNIPLVSYLVLMGRCRSCGEKISIQYPLVEVIAGGIMGVLALNFLPLNSGEWINFVTLAFFLMMLIPITVIDLKHRIIPNSLNLILFLGGAALSPLPRHPWAEGAVELSVTVLASSWAGGLVGGGVMLGLAYGAHWYYGEVALGMGDVKFLAAAGLWMGPAYIMMALFAGAILGALIGTIVGATTGKGMKMQIPFGPFLCLGAGLMFLAGEPILSWWLGV